jgi:murein DD-endopeptidase MepM/ murein hydrolase activator NlpD
MLRLEGLDGSARPHGDVGHAPFLVEGFEYAPAELLLRLSLRLSFELPSPAHPTLVIESEVGERAHPALLARSGRAPAATGEWTWRGAFAIAPDAFGDSRASFAVRFHDDLLLRLPAPHERVLDIKGSSRREAGGFVWPHTARCVALVSVITCQLCLAPGWSSGAALADGSPGAGAGAEVTPETPPVPPLERPAEPTPETPTTTTPPLPPTGPVGPTPETPLAPAAGPEPPAAQVPPAPPAGAPGTPTSGAPFPPAGPQGTSSSQTPPSSPVISSQASTVRPHKATPKAIPAPHLVDHHSSMRDSPRKPRGHSGPRDRDAEAPAYAPVPSNASPVAPFSEVPAVLTGLPSGLEAIAEDRPPAYLIPIYTAAGHRYHVPWRVLAAINAIETDYGRNLSVSSAGAIGWMQFMPSTWREWAVDADHDGQLNPYSPQDAIFTAARYLQASGASRDLPAAIFAYNHADWYVTEVLLRAQMLGNVASVARIEKGYSLPLDARYMSQLGRTDDGVDIETAPDGALVYSMTPGIVSAVASDPAGFGPNYPVIQATSGSLAGQHIYYGHVAKALVHPGEAVTAGQPIAVMGHAGDAAALGHGHIEIGFSDAGGDPLSHHGAEASTIAGDVMRSFLVTLSASFGVDNA